MTWTYDEIEQDWLLGGVIAVPPDVVVSAFDRCEQLLGRDWILEYGGNAVGAQPTLDLVTRGPSFPARRPA